MEKAVPPAIIAAGIGAVGAIGGGLLASKGSSNAAKAQTQADQAAIGEQQRQFDITNQNFAPYRQAGTQALGGISDLTGLSGGPQQQTAIDALRQSPYYQSLYRNGQDAVLQNASATGGLRGGNTQLGLANFGADTLSQTIQQQLANLGGLAGLGEGATNATAGFGQNSANNISGLLVGQGNASASNALAQGGIWGSVLKNLSQLSTQAAFPHGGF